MSSSILSGKSRADLARFSGSDSQFFGVQAITLADGAERGIRCLDFRTGGGLRFRVAIDRAFDIVSAEFEGVELGWTSPTGLRHAGLHENADEGGLGWLRSFSGLMVTAGLDHTLFMASDDAGHYGYPGRQRVEFGLHGRIANIPGQLRGYGADWDGDRCTLWCEGLVRQAAVFGENLLLTRRIEAPVGENRLIIRDRVDNAGFSPTPHMLLYHFNLGHPLLDENSEYIAPVLHTIWAAHADRLRSQDVGWRLQSGPKAGFSEQVYQHALAAHPDGTVRSALVNRKLRGGRGLGLAITVNQKQFPCQLQWQNFQEGLYALAIEPSTNHALGRDFARQRGELIVLQHGQGRSYVTELQVLEDGGAIERFAREVRALAPTPPSDFSEPTGGWPG
jgi:hypothetical protein